MASPSKPVVPEHASTKGHVRVAQYDALETVLVVFGVQDSVATVEVLPGRQVASAVVMLAQ
jgi:hypothetical protein